MPFVHCLSQIPKNSCRSMPNQNTGSETSSDVDSVTMTSQNEYCLTADTMPAPIPMTISMRMAATASSAVYGYFSRKMSFTDRPEAIDVPKSPLKMSRR